jgi:hypothetical protein
MKYILLSLFFVLGGAFTSSLGLILPSVLLGLIALICFWFWLDLLIRGDKSNVQSETTGNRQSINNRHNSGSSYDWTSGYDSSNDGGCGGGCGGD